jgi:MFS family permease
MLTVDAYRRIFASGPYRLFWVGFTLSALGDSMTRVALIWYVYDLTRSARAIGGLLLCYTGPIVVGGLMAGVLLDRFGRRRTMLADNAVRGVVVAAVPILAALDRLALWHLYLVAAVYGLLMMISLAGGPSLVPSLVPREQLATANALEMVSFTATGVVGPPLAGLLIGAIGAPNVLLLDVASYAAFTLALARIAAPETAGDARAGGAHGLRQAVGLLVGNRILLATTAMFMAFNIGNGLLAVWLPLLADRVLGGGPGLYGSLLGALAAGQVASALLAGGLTFPLSLGTLICLAQTCSGLALLIILAGRNVPAAAIGLALWGACSSPLTVWAQTLRMQIIPERLRGRAFALLRTIMQGGNPLGGTLAGLLLPILGVPAMIGLSSLIVAVPGLLGLAVGELRVADRPVAPAAPVAPGTVTESTPPRR